MNSTSEPIFGITLGWLPILLIWLPLSIWLLRKFGLGLKPGPFKWAILGFLGLIFAALPVGDDAYIQWHFNRLCRDAGMHYEKKIAVDGYYDDTSTGAGTAGPIISPQAIEHFDRAGFRFFERRAGYVPGKYGDQPVKFAHVEKVEGKWEVSILDRPMARYHYKYLSQHEPIAFRVRKVDIAIVDTETNKVVGRQLIYTRYSGWLDGLWLGFFDARGNQCPPSGKQGELRPTVLIPKNKQ